MADEGCCTDRCGGASHPHPPVQQHHDDVENDPDLILDPTLLSCCEKDRLAYRKAMALKEVLTAQDPTTQNVRVRQEIILPPPGAMVTTQAPNATTLADRLKALAMTQADSHSHWDDDAEEDDSDLELDDDFDALMASRRQELAAQFELAARNAAEGYGILAEVDLSTLLVELQGKPEVPRVVFTRSARLDGSEVQDMLREMLNMARRFVGTKFYSALVRPNDPRDDEALRQLRVTSANSIIAFRHGQRVDATLIQDRDLASSASILWEARLVPWLTMCNVLEVHRQEPSSSKRRHSPSAGTQPDADEPAAFDCGVDSCRIRFAYEHEHVGPSKEAKTEISAWRSG